MTVWFMRWPQCPLCEQFTSFHAGIAAGATCANTNNECRNNVLPTRKRAHALNHGDAIV